MSYDPRVEPHAALLMADEIGDYTPINEWKRVAADTDQTTDQTTLADTALGFTPVANKKYLLDATLLLRSADALVGPVIGWAAPTGMSDGAAIIEGPTAATVYATRAVTGFPGLPLTLATFPTANASYLVRLRGMILVGASPGAGLVRIQLASSLLLTVITLKARSHLLYRTV